MLQPVGSQRARAGAAGEQCERATGNPYRQVPLGPAAAGRARGSTRTVNTGATTGNL